jgi:hypothetical protein
LAAASTFSKLDQKNVTAWLDLRNKAAHGKYAEYETPQVNLLIGGIRDFIKFHHAKPGLNWLTSGCSRRRPARSWSRRG